MPQITDLITADILVNLCRIGLFFGIFIVISTAACLIDLFSGVTTARYLGERLRSHRFRDTIFKITLYWAAQILSLLAGLILALSTTLYNFPYLSALITLGILIVEGKSVCEHARRRRHGLAKVPEAIIDLARYANITEAETRQIIAAILHRALAEESPEK